MQAFTGAVCSGWPSREGSLLRVEGAAVAQQVGAAGVADPADGTRGQAPVQRQVSVQSPPAGEVAAADGTGHPRPVTAACKSAAGSQPRPTHRRRAGRADGGQRPAKALLQVKGKTELPSSFANNPFYQKMIIILHSFREDANSELVTHSKLNPCAIYNSPGNGVEKDIQLRKDGTPFYEFSPKSLLCLLNLKETHTRTLFALPENRNRIPAGIDLSLSLAVHSHLLDIGSYAGHAL